MTSRRRRLLPLALALPVLLLGAWELPAASAAIPALALLGEVFASGTVPHVVRALATVPG